MKEEEIRQLAVEEPDYYQLALEMERLYRAGRHFRGDDQYSVKARHRQTGEQIEIALTADSPVTARRIFRQTHADTRKPHRYKLSVSSAVVGLGRNFAWSGRISLPVSI